MAPLGWLVLALVFLDEVLAAVAAGFGAHDRYGVVGSVLGPALVVAVWWAFAAPKAPYGGPVRRPLAKLVVLGTASAALWAAGHHGGAVSFLVFSVIVNALARLPFVRALVPEAPR